MFDLMPSRACGANVYQPSQSTTPLHTTPTTNNPPEDDDEPMEMDGDDGGAGSGPDQGSDEEEMGSEPLGTQEWLPSPAPTHRCKTSAIDTTTTPTPPAPAKKGRVIPILELTNKLGELTDVYCQSKVVMSSSLTLTPKRECAIQDVEEDPFLDIMEKVSLLNAFMRSNTAVGIYSALPRGSEIRTAWAKDQFAQEAATCA